MHYRRGRFVLPLETPFTLESPLNRLALAALFASTLAFAADLKPAQEEAKAKFDEAMEEPLKALNEKCGTKVTVKSDYENYKEADWAGRSYYSWCEPAMSAITQMCADRPAYKKALSKLSGFSCLFTGVKPKDKKDGSSDFTLRNMSYEKGTFTFRIHPDQANVAESAKATVEKALN